MSEGLKLLAKAWTVMPSSVTMKPSHARLPLFCAFFACFGWSFFASVALVLFVLKTLNPKP